MRFYKFLTGSINYSKILEHAYDRLIAGVTQISKNISMTRHEKLGFLTFSPENMGNTLTVSVEIKLEKLPMENIDEIMEKFALKYFNHSKLSKEKTNVYEVYSKKRLGVTEFLTVNEFAVGINALLEAENSF